MGHPLEGLEAWVGQPLQRPGGLGGTSPLKAWRLGWDIPLYLGLMAWVGNWLRRDVSTHVTEMWATPD